MKARLKKTLLALTLNALCLGLLTLMTGCTPWQGDEQVTVSLGDKTATVNLKDLYITTYNGTNCVRLSDIVKKSKLASTANLANYYYNFVSSDGIDMSAGFTADMSLPTWTDMLKGYVYDNDGSLTVIWDPTSVPGADTGTYYSVKSMNGGTIQIVESNIEAPTDPWVGDEEVIVTFGNQTATVKLKDLNKSTYSGITGVRLSDVVKKANLTAAANLANDYFNFIASDGFDMSTKATSKGLPNWASMQKGYLYESGTSSGLTVKWETGTTPGDYGKFYNAKLMDGGTIQIREKDVM